MLSALLCDMGNVLIRYDPPHFLDRLGITDPADRELLLGEIFASPLWPKLDSGELDEPDLEAPRPAPAARAAPQRGAAAAVPLGRPHRAGARHGAAAGAV